MSDTFRFKRFEVRNSASAQKVGTDGVLLGAWTSLPKGDEPRILDIGTGTGVIALMLAQRCAGARITGIDIDAPSVEEASLNFASSPWSGRLAASLSSVQQFEGGPFDLIVSNPPFFINSLKAPSCRRSAARHTDTLSHRELAASALRLLSAGGIFSVVYPPEEGEAFVFEAEGNGLHLVRKCEVCTMPGKGVKRVLLEFSRTASDRFSSEKMCICTTLDTFSPEYVEILKDFYLKF